jgi:ABC-type dipeptide/oligopeptide/nickel transport system ATPase component
MNIYGTEGKHMLMQKSFLHPSINVRFDMGRGEFLERYLPTPSHAESLKGILKGFLNKGSHAHIIVGSYGSGKSLLTTIIAGIVSKSVDRQSYLNMLEKFKTVDEGESTIEYLEELYNQPTKYIPIVLNGNQGSLRRDLMVSLYKTLSEYGFDFSLPSISIEIEKTIEMWKTGYISAYNAFLLKLNDSDRDLKHFFLDIENYDINAVEWFKGVYTQITNGSILSLAYDKDIVSQLEYVLKELRNKGLGIFFVYDEFGRFMQTLDTEETHNAMRDLQDLAELANKDDSRNLQVLFITHRNMRQYALKYQNEEIEKEFQKIEDRFSVYYTITDQSTFVRLASAITSEYRKNTKYKEYINELRRFNLFEDLTIFEVESLVIKGAYPLHPVTLFIMTHLANQVAQNERTLFTFLESDEIGGLIYQYQKGNDWYRVDTLFDYFEPSINDFEKESIIGQYYLLFQRLQRKLIVKETRNDELKVIKLLTLWNIAGLHIKQLPSEDLIAFALSWDLGYVTETLKSLFDKKVIRYNYKDGYWDLFEGSSVDVENEISQRQNKLVMSPRERMDLLCNIMTRKFILAKDYNDQKSMTRFAYVQPVQYSELISGDVTAEKLRTEDESDAVILLVIGQSKFDKKSLKRVKELSINEDLGLFATSQVIESDLIEQISKLLVVKQLQNDQYFLSQDMYLADELQKNYEDITYSINRIMDSFFNFNSGFWFYKGKEFEVSSESELNIRVSEIFTHIFNETPEFRNEAFNRRNISKIQRNSAITVLDKLLQAQSTNELVFEGNGPDSFINKTILMNTGINLEHPDQTNNPQLLLLITRLRNILDLRKGKVEALFKVFTNIPFGIRRSLIPLLLVSLLKLEWKHIMFFNKGIYNSEVDGKLLYYMVENPEDYTFSYHPFEKKYEELNVRIEETFEEFVELKEQILHPAVYANRIMLRWLKSLPRLTQNTNSLSETALNFRNILRKGEVEPDECLEALYKSFSNDHSYLDKIRYECDKFISEHHEKIKHKILNSTNTSSYEELKEWAQDKTPIVSLKNELVRCLIEADGENWVDELCKKMIGVNRENWSDATDQLFMNQIVDYLQKLTDNSYKSYLEVKLGEEVLAIPQVELSVKSKLILNNLQQDVKLMGRTVPKEEIQTLLLLLLRDFMKD